MSNCCGPRLQVLTEVAGDGEYSQMALSIVYDCDCPISDGGDEVAPLTPSGKDVRQPTS